MKCHELQQARSSAGSNPKCFTVSPPTSDKAHRKGVPQTMRPSCSEKGTMTASFLAGSIVHPLCNISHPGLGPCSSSWIQLVGIACACLRRCMQLSPNYEDVGADASHLQDSLLMERIWIGLDSSLWGKGIHRFPVSPRSRMWVWSSTSWSHLR